MASAHPRVELDSSVGYRLKGASSALHTAMERVLRPLGLTITQYSCLELLAQRPRISGAELARGVFVTRQSMALVVQSLTKEGLVAREPVAAQGRALPVELTALGRDRLKEASEAVREVEERMLAGATSAERERLAELLDDCIRRLGAGDEGTATA